MGHLTLTPRARADLDDTWLHALNNPVAADRLIDEIAARCENLTAHLLLGPARPEIAPDARLLISAITWFSPAWPVTTFKLFVWCMGHGSSKVCSTSHRTTLEFIRIA